MKISYSWLKEFISFSESPKEVSEILTQTGLEVEGIEKIEKIPGGLSGIVVGEVAECEQHPNADKLKVTKVDIGAEELSNIICGAPNVAQGQKVLVATVNSTIYPTNGEPFKIKKAKIRGEVSMGMICAEDEIGLGSSHDGIMVLDTIKPNGTPAIELFDTGEDYTIEIGLTPNRGDATSHLGTARDLKAYFRKDICKPEPKPFEIKVDKPISVKVENSEACPRYSGITIRGVKVEESPDWLQWKLKAIGLEPINNIVDITNYVLHGLGQPMHAFDADEITTGEVVVKTLPSKSKFTTLDEKERELHEKDLMICNGDDEGMCIAGVFGGIKSGVKKNTTSIFLESAYFSADWVRATAMRHTLSTDASFRYERGTDPNITLEALNLATSLILEIAGGEVASEVVDIYPHKIEPIKIDVTFRHFSWLIGKDLSNKLILEILNWLEIQTENITEEGFTAIVPSYRSEVTRPADLVEEVLRIYGFNAIELDEDFSSDYLAQYNEFEPYKVQEDISKFLAGRGYSEILTNSLSNPKHLEKIELDRSPVSMLNPSSEDLAVMKTSPVLVGLESLAYNINRRNKHLKFFEIGKSYQVKDGEYIEHETLSIYLTGKSGEEYWLDQPRNIVFHDLNNTVNALLKYVGIRKIDIDSSVNEKLFEYGLNITKNKNPLLQIGKLKKSITNVFGIDQEVFYAEIDWETLLRFYKSDISYQPIPKFPEVKRDLSLVIDKQVSFAEIQRLALKYEKNLLNRMNLFSVYEGEKIEKDKKAYAISFFLQDKFKTLADKQIDKVMNGLISLYERELGAVIRK